MQLQDHQDVCALNVVSCGICGEQVRPGAMAQHNQSGAERHVKLLETRAKDVALVLEELPKQLELLRTQGGTLESIQAALASLEKKQASLERRLNESTAASELEVVWPIPDCRVMLRTCPRNVRLESDSFDLGGAQSRLCIFPNGQDPTPGGYFCMNLRSEVGWRVTYSLQVGTETQRRTDDFSTESPWGVGTQWSANLLPAEGKLEISVRLHRRVRLL